MSSTDLRVGVIGAGYWGPNLIRNCAELGVLAGVCDVNPAALDQIKSAYPRAFVSSDPSSFLAGPLDAVIIAAPAALHAELALAALAAGKHVFVEKPLALTVEDGERVVRAAEKTGLQVFVGHLLLYHPAVVRLRELVAQGAVGDVWHVRSKRFQLGKVRTKETVWWSFATHDVAVALALLGNEVTGVRSAQCGRYAEGIWDAAYADFSFADGRSAHIEVCWLHPEKTARLEVLGSEGVITLDDGRAGSKLVLHPCGVRRQDDGQPQIWRQDPREIEVAAGEPLRAEIEAFLEAARTGTPAPTDAREGLAVLRALTMADEAALKSFAAPVAVVKA